MANGQTIGKLLLPLPPGQTLTDDLRVNKSKWPRIIHELTETALARHCHA